MGWVPLGDSAGLSQPGSLMCLRFNWDPCHRLGLAEGGLSSAPCVSHPPSGTSGYPGDVLLMVETETQASQDST